MDCQAFEPHETSMCGDCRGRYPGGELDHHTGRCAPCQAAYAATHPPCQHPRAVPTRHNGMYCPDCEAEWPLVVPTVQQRIHHKDGDPRNNALDNLVIEETP